ncbi:hypothetical protein R1sor_027559 [Riccia sorocarpa]|uniref:Uncharacterized protein n=1 Tax=Riccia sorocarpa TaxID=122646 RepID=A0ABD3GG82_9MARC
MSEVAMDVEIEDGGVKWGDKAGERLASANWENGKVLVCDWDGDAERGDKAEILTGKPKEIVGLWRTHSRREWTLNLIEKTMSLGQ